jgi:transposase
MERKALGRRLGSKNYSKECRAMVVAQANDPERSIADVAQEHGLNANMIARWRRMHERSQSIPLPQPAETFIPVQLAWYYSSVAIAAGTIVFGRG